MLNAILNGALGETSSRTGSSSSSRSGTTVTTYSIATPSGTYTGLTLDQYNQAKYALEKYNDAYGIAYSYDLTEPDWSKFTASNAQSIVDDYAKRAIESGKKSKSEGWAKFAAERYAATVAPTEPKQPAATQPTDQVSTGNKIIDKLIEDGMAQQVSELPEFVGQNWSTPIIRECVEYAKANNFPLPSSQWVESFGYNALPKLKELVAERDRTGINVPDPYAPKVVIPENVVPTVSVAPSEDKGSSLLVPGIILALGVIGAIALTSKSKKRR